MLATARLATCLPTAAGQTRGTSYSSSRRESWPAQVGAVSPLHLPQIELHISLTGWLCGSRRRRASNVATAVAPPPTAAGHHGRGSSFTWASVLGFPFTGPRLLTRAALYFSISLTWSASWPRTKSASLAKSRLEECCTHAESVHREIKGDAGRIRVPRASL